MLDLLLAVLGRGEAPFLDRLGPHEWDGLRHVACQHRVAPLLWHRLLERGDAGNVPGAIRQSLTAVCTVEALRAKGREQQLAEILDALRGRDVPAVLLKGIYLAEHVYPSATLRPMGDIDLLIPADAFESAVDALAGVGYTPPDDASRAAYLEHRHPPPLRRRGYLTVELHVSVEPCTPPFGLPLSAVWERVRPVPAAGHCALALAPEDLLIHLATHMGRSHLLGASLVSVCDVAMWLERFGEVVDWEAVVLRARESGTRRFVYAALEMAHATFGTSAPLHPRLALRGDGDDAVIADAMRVLRWPRDFPGGPLGLLTARPTAWGGVRRLAHLLVVEPLRGVGDVPGESIPPEALVARWIAATRFLLDPSSLSAVRHQTARVRHLRQWALGDE